MFLKELHGLRGIAVLFVLLFHFFPSTFPGGFMGVDIFFALSGFLVCRSVMKNFKSDKSSAFLQRFYARRVARILPMSLFVGLISLPLALFFSLEHGIHQSFKFFTSSVIGFTNISLYFSMKEYFAIGQKYNFFTQYWSLGIEEQFYLLFSIVAAVAIMGERLFRGLSRWHLLGLMLIVGTLGSLGLSAMFYFKSMAASFGFYLLPVRWWEMAAGVIISMLLFDKANEKFKQLEETTSIRLLKNTILLLLFSVLFVSYDKNNFPFPYAFLPVGGTLFFCAFAHSEARSWASRFLRLNILQWLGTISFSLYLIHWIIVVLLKYTVGLNPSFTISIAGMFGSIALAGIAYILLEKPANSSLRVRPQLALSSFAVCMVAVVSLYTYNNVNPIKYNPVSMENVLGIKMAESWVGKRDCHGKEATTPLDKALVDCLQPQDIPTKPKTVFLNGDSHAAHYSYMLDQAFKDTPYQVRFINAHPTKDALSFIMHSVKEINETPPVMEWIIDHAKDGDIFALAFWSMHLKPIHVQAGAIDKGIEILGGYFKHLAEKNVSVILIYGTPTFAENTTPCYFSYNLHQNPYSTACSITREEAEGQRRLQKDMFKTLASQHQNVSVFDPFPLICSDQHCSIFKEGRAIYFDKHHLSVEGARSLGEDFLTFYRSIAVAEKPTTREVL